MLLLSCVSDWLSVAFVVVNLVLFLRPVLFIFYLKKWFEEHIGASIKVDSPSGTKYLSLMSEHTHTHGLDAFKRKTKITQNKSRWQTMRE